jgi:hypothetical protein
MEQQTPTEQPKTRYEILAEQLPAVIRALPNREDKAICMTMLGDTRYAQFRQTARPEYLRLAKNCYMAARHFHNRRN